jgi:hypothetical protein
VARKLRHAAAERTSFLQWLSRNLRAAREWQYHFVNALFDLGLERATLRRASEIERERRILFSRCRRLLLNNA